MEIREGIIYQVLDEDLKTVLVTATISKSATNPKKFYANFHDGGTSTDYTAKQFIRDFKKDKTFKIINYPYKVGDWVYDKEDLYIQQTPKICQITKIDLEIIYVNNESFGLTFEDFNREYRPCFEDEIPTKVVIKEDLTQLKDLLLKIK